MAEAFHAHHPDYYFLIDRDHYDDKIVESCWKNFPDPGCANILIWRLREIENYFLDHKLLAISRHLSVPETSLCEEILKRCQERLYIDVANYVIIALREDQKKTWIKCFTDVNCFTTKDEALKKLSEMN